MPGRLHRSQLCLCLNRESPSHVTNQYYQLKLLRTISLLDAISSVTRYYDMFSGFTLLKLPGS